MKLEGKLALVTGSSQGIGQRIVLRHGGLLWNYQEQ
jgi:NAD(P)-dependent dehydrogenase (short-subunit alcohol dehydrogenase family)